jgi:hypothetical protein
MTIISSRTDLITYLADTRPDLDAYHDDIADQLQASDHPDWGDEWADWLAETLDRNFVDTLVHGVDAITTRVPPTLVERLIAEIDGDDR